MTQRRSVHEPLTAVPSWRGMHSSGSSAACQGGRGSEGGLSRPVRLGCFVTLAPFILPRLLAAAAERHPQLRIEVLEGEANELDRALRTGQTDFAITYDLGLGQVALREELDDFTDTWLSPPATHAEMILPSQVAAQSPQTS